MLALFLNTLFGRFVAVTGAVDPADPGPPWLVLAADGTSFTCDDAVLSSAGVSYSVIAPVLSADGTSYSPV